MRQPRYTWNKAEKLKSRKRIEKVFKEGRSFSVFPFRVFYVLSPAPEKSASTGNLEKSASTAPVQAGFGAASRQFGRAVDRNRIKRLSREAWRLQKQPLIESLREKGLALAIFFIYTGKELPDFRLVSGKIGVILQKLVKETA